MEVARQTISNHETGATTQVRRMMLRQWALACGVSYEWLTTGTAPDDPAGGEYAPRDSNPEPSD
jgi:hypothetical protein